ncbi:hypothetical protein [Sphaerisporangium perillae]|uniref:hypothetical protein n=1 Tax=Sphaerisporangium perillae TaxID=2935860 RepID=UPI0020103916|nr:hypothetical protein [Sphaerisporangium perillae]
MKWSNICFVTLGTASAVSGWLAFLPLPGDRSMNASQPGMLIHLRPWMAVACLGFAVALVVLRNGRYKRHAKPVTPSPWDGVTMSTMQKVMALRDEAVRSDKLTSVPIFLSMLLQPEKSRTRTVETISLEGRVVVQDVRVEMSLSALEGPWSMGTPASGVRGRLRGATAGPQQPSGEVYAPILTCLKREMVDNFEVRDRDGGSLDILCYEETIQLISSSLHFLIKLALRETHGGSSVTADRIDRAVVSFLMPICGRMSPKASATAIHKGLAYIGIGDDDLSDNVMWLKEFLATLDQAFPIVVVIPHTMDSQRLQISYRRTMVPPNKSRQARHRLRLTLGLRPVTMQMAPGMAHNSKVYHLQIKAPESQYLMEQTLRCTDCGSKLSNSEIETDGSQTCSHVKLSQEAEPYFQLLSKRGQNYAHLYMRGFTGMDWKKIRFTSSFGEVPPGTLASAVVTAATSLFLIGAVALAEARGLPRTSDVPALLLALPAVAASWFGFSSDNEAVLRSSLAARCSLLLGGLTSLAACALFILTRTVDHTQSIDSVTLMDNEMRWWGWVGLAYLAGVNFGYVLIQLIIRSGAYRRLLRKESVVNDNTVI